MLIYRYFKHLGLTIELLKFFLKQKLNLRIFIVYLDFYNGFFVTFATQ